MEHYSEEHLKYIKNKNKRNIMVNVFRFLIIFIVIVLWEVLARFEVINTFLYSSPSNIFKTIYELFCNGDLFRHIGITLFEVLVSFILSVGLGFFISTILWCNKFISDVVDPYLTIINSLPKVSIGPLIILWCGASIKSIIFMSLLISLFITIINIYDGFKSVDKNLITMLKSFGANKWQLFKYVVLPSSKGTIISTLKINISMNLIGM